MKKTLFLFLAAGLIYACKKDNIGSKPMVSFKSYSADSITPETQQFNVTLRVEDGDGDIEDSIWLAILIKSQQEVSKDTLWGKYKMPGIGQNRGNRIKADVILGLQQEHFAFNYTARPNDSAHFVTYLRDSRGNISDTIATPIFPFRRNQ
ncbi:hypothetical protein [Chitinophaga solisilvae]|uniref:Uncharacterized protein n=1 Tax=Chitinophaga solisilvae TaxID=1233460 RepID=A0A433WIU0_9BACT|nr:hypothetical protein [Chitinophaga solisilvae]NSL87897.1 hypothetical protein [Chitinophaga solisilvae]